MSLNIDLEFIRDVLVRLVQTDSRNPDMCTYPPRCKVSIERRKVAGETEPGVRKELQLIFDSFQEQDQDFKARLSLIAHRTPLVPSSNSSIKEALKEGYTRVIGEQPAIGGAAYWTDAALLAEQGMEVVLIGPVGKGLHSAEEWVDLKSVYDLAEILAETEIMYCQ